MPPACRAARGLAAPSVTPGAEGRQKPLSSPGRAGASPGRTPSPVAPRCPLRPATTAGCCCPPNHSLIGPWGAPAPGWERSGAEPCLPGGTLLLPPALCPVRGAGHQPPAHPVAKTCPELRAGAAQSLVWGVDTAREQQGHADTGLSPHCALPVPCCRLQCQQCLRARGQAPGSSAVSPPSWGSQEEPLVTAGCRAVSCSVAFPRSQLLG